jgi:hypothetical protein
MRSPRTNPARTRLARTAVATANEVGALTATSAANPAAHAYWTISNDARPLT